MLAQPNRSVYTPRPYACTAPQLSSQTRSPAARALPATEAGVTRQMLESLDRPVRCEPEW